MRVKQNKKNKGENPEQQAAEKNSAASHAILEDGQESKPSKTLFARIKGLFYLQAERSVARVGLVSFCFVLLFGAISAKLVYLAVTSDTSATARRYSANDMSASRPDIVDRNGEILATDVRTWSIFAEPRNIIDRDEAVEKLTAVFPDLNARELYDKLGTGKGFVWVKRQITPKQQADAYRQGIPGVGFLPDNKRVYPNGPAGAHILGFTNIDNHGIAGIEKYIDNQGLQDLSSAGFLVDSNTLKPVQLSLDLRVEHVMRDELVKGLEKFKALANGGLVMDVNTGEIISLVSLPDYNPNNPVDALEKDRINRINVGVYEMGSTFKALTLAMGMDSGKFTINSTLDARSKLHYGKFSIGDYHGTNRILTVPEVFLHSSNIGTARIALGVGVEGHKAFLRKMGQLTRLRTELPENAEPIVPSRWGELNTVTISYGHGLAVAPLQATMAVAALVNGGYMITPTFLKRTEEEARQVATQVIKPETSEAMRYIMRLNAVSGSASKASVAGYFVGGKTGTADKVIGGRYAKNKNFTTFMAVFPSDKPKYLVLVIFDEPKGLPETYGYSTAAWNAGEVTGKIIRRIAPLLGVEPRFEPPAHPFPLMEKLGAWGTK
ncbi:penicillin-binding protein 2 [Microvirga sp. W0021]|uniref:Penicillin-binding protein 2 n=1 Tax=Hohaiivirga grylli TaxID=3133970 RepID=A0ABV0BK43_9HYPH